MGESRASTSLCENCDATMATCGLCLKHVPKLARSHLFPRALGTALLAEGPLAKLATGPQGRISKSPDLGYVRVVCKQCEASSQLADEELIRFSRYVEAARSAAGEGVSHQIIEVPSDTSLLHRACVQMLFRTHLSDRPEHREIRLDGRAESIRLCLLASGDTWATGIQACIISRVDLLGQGVLSPLNVFIDDRPFFAFFAPGLEIYMSNGQLRLPYAFRKVRLTKSTTVTVVPATTASFQMERIARALEDSGGMSALDGYFQAMGKKSR
ncbi:hypothetical protein [Tahibacter sp.]|uniref:hypothetical protein n=1 Tax=Tahibacter sp. TaxID=2056211 RepID=UPI0028C4215F|nr:hypothetical protein [Tahibacter sp.]